MNDFDSFFLDTDECARNISGCIQNCINSIGSYICSCHPGYDIKDDKRICIGTEYSPVLKCAIHPIP